MPVTKSMLMSGCAIFAYAAITVLSPAAGFARDDAEVWSAAQDAAGLSHNAPTESSRVARNGLSQDLTITRARLQEDGVQDAEVFRFNLSGLLSGYVSAAQSAGTAAAPHTQINPGPSCNATSNTNLQCGAGAVASLRQATAIGVDARATGEESTALGYLASATVGQATALGHAASAVAQSTALGQSASATGELSIAVGRGASATVANSTAVGAATRAAGLGGTALGYDASASGFRGIALGISASAVGEFSIAVGGFAVAEHERSIALGHSSATSAPFTVSVGNASTGEFRRITNLDDGVDDRDAVTLRQVTGLAGALDTRITANTDGLSLLVTDVGALGSRVTVAESDIAVLQGQIATGNVGLVLQAGADEVVTVAAATGGGLVDFTGADGVRTLSGVAEGDVSANSDEAVTGAQLFATNLAIASNGAGIEQANQRLAMSLGGGAAFDAGTGLFTGPSFVVMGTPYDNVGGAIGALNTKVVENTADIADLRSNGGGGGSVPDARIAALEAQLAALQGALQAASEQLAMIQQGNIAGGAVTDSTNLATGAGSQATGHGDTAYGVGALANGDRSTAIGFEAQASGQHSTAIGGNAQATGNLSVALGQGSDASGANAVALGQGASASFDNSIAIGQGVATTRGNQVAIGTGTNTYTLAGINSVASRAAQSGRTYMVTSDAMGNLATMDIEPWFTRIEGLEDAIGSTQERLRTQADGIAVSLALGGAQVIQPGQTFSVSANLGHFDGSSAVGFGAIGRARENVFVNIGVGAGSRTGAVAGRAGISWGW